MTTPVLSKDPTPDALSGEPSRDDIPTLVAADSKTASLSALKPELDAEDTKSVNGAKDLEKQDEAAEPATATDERPGQDGVLHGWRMVLVFGALMLVVFVS